jgi:hypothetical protein
MLVSSISFFLIGLFAAPASIAMCALGEDIDLRKSKAEAFKQLPVLDQGGYGLCYSYAASTLIDFQRITLESNREQRHMTDPTAAALLAAPLVMDDDVEGGQICDVVNSLSSLGYACSNAGIVLKQVRSMGVDLHPRLAQVFMPFLTREQEFKAVSPKFVNTSHRQKNLKKLTIDQQQMLARYDELEKWIEIELKIRVLSRDRLPNRENLFSFFQNVYINNSWASFAAEFNYLLIRKTCENSKFSMPKLRCLDFERFDRFSMLDANLAAQRPVGVSFCSTVLTDKNHTGLVKAGQTADCAPHAVVVVGRRNHFGTCQYLIRNSWGVSKRYPWPVSNGDIWVDEPALRRNTFKVSVVVPE